MTKQALLHHFGNKQKLYGEVLLRISDNLMVETHRILEREREPAARLTELVVAQLRGQLQDREAASLIMRELLDNESRAGSATSWYLQPYLETLVETALEVGAPGVDGRGEALAMVYQFLGAAHYFAISGPTLARMFGRETYDTASARYEAELRALIGARLT